MLKVTNISKNENSGYWVLKLSNNDKILLTNEQYGELENQKSVFESTSGNFYSPLLENKSMYFKVA